MNKKTILILASLLTIISCTKEKKILDVLTPDYSAMTMTAKQSEAKSLLLSYYMQQKMHWAETGTYNLGDLTDESELNTETYTVHHPQPTDEKLQKLCPDCGVKASTFIVIVSANLDDDDTLDVWSINEKKEFTNIQSDINK